MKFKIQFMEYSYREVSLDAKSPVDAIRVFTEDQSQYVNSSAEFDRAYAHITDIECLEEEP